MFDEGFCSVSVLLLRASQPACPVPLGCYRKPAFQSPVHFLFSNILCSPQPRRAAKGREGPRRAEKGPGFWSCCIDRNCEQDLEAGVLWEADQSQVLGCMVPGMWMSPGFNMAGGLGTPSPRAQRQGAQPVTSPCISLSPPG